MLMRKSGLVRPSLYALFLVALLAGCGSNPFDPPPIDDDPGLPPGTPLNDTPQNTMLRFEAAYENKVAVEYEKLLASNFRFTFSNQSDPDLVNEYGNNWGKDDEIESTRHLFEGFTSAEPPYEYQGPASAIALSLNGASFIDDPSRPDSAAFYKYVIVPSVDLTITIAGTEEQIYEISAPHDFYLVRGDVAVLDANQEATANRWYIYRWDDKSPAIAGVAPRLASLAASDQPVRVTWGLLKSSYAGTP
jgi:hypothetical protein